MRPSPVGSGGLERAVLAGSGSRVSYTVGGTGRNGNWKEGVEKIRCEEGRLGGRTLRGWESGRKEDVRQRGLESAIWTPSSVSSLTHPAASPPAASPCPFLCLSAPGSPGRVLSRICRGTPLPATRPTSARVPLRALRPRVVHLAPRWAGRTPDATSLLGAMPRRCVAPAGQLPPPVHFSRASALSISPPRRSAHTHARAPP